jgi:hypothetical protein
MLQLCTFRLPPAGAFHDSPVSWRVRDAVLRGLLVQRVAAAPTNAMRKRRNVAPQFAALMRVFSAQLTGAEIDLRVQWLDTIGTIADLDIVNRRSGPVSKSVHTTIGTGPCS